MMVIYEVTLSVNKNILESFPAWLNEHMLEMLKLTGFQEAKLLVLTEPESEVKNFVIHYIVDSLKNLEDYFTYHANAMRQKGKDKFGEALHIQRRILQLEKTLTGED